MAGKGAGGKDQGLFGAALPLVRMSDPGAERMIAELKEIVGAVGAGVRVQEAGKSSDSLGVSKLGGRLLGGMLGAGSELRCQIAGINLVIRITSGPFCKPALLPGFVNPMLWQGSLKQLAAHRAHVLVAETDAGAGTSRDALFDRATAATLATAAMASLMEPLGVAWLPARNLVPVPLFGSEMERFMEGEAPLRLWMRWRVLVPPVQEELELGELSGKALNPGVATVGLSAFLGAELVAPPSTADHEAMLDQVFALASAVIDENLTLKNGAVFKQSAGPELRLAWREESQWLPVPHWELVPRPAPAPAQPAPKPAITAAPDVTAGAEADDEAGRRIERRLRLVSRGK